MIIVYEISLRTMPDEGFISLFTFAAVGSIALANLILSYSPIHMAKLRSVRVAID